MAAKAKKISVNAWENIVNGMRSNTVTVSWRGEELTITRTLSLSDMLQFVRSCTDVCFTSGGVYMPEKLPFAIKLCLIGFYTNMTLPLNPAKQYELIYRSDIVETVIGHINKTQFDEICDAVNERVQYRADANIETTEREMNKLKESFENIEKQITDTFSNVDEDDIKAVISAISGSGLDEEKLVKAYLEQKGME